MDRCLSLAQAPSTNRMVRAFPDPLRCARRVPVRYQEAGRVRRRRRRRRRRDRQSTVQAHEHRAVERPDGEPERGPRVVYQSRSSRIVAAAGRRVSGRRRQRPPSQRPRVALRVTLSPRAVAPRALSSDNCEHRLRARRPRPRRAEPDVRREWARRREYGTRPHGRYRKTPTAIRLSPAGRKTTENRPTRPTIESKMAPWCPYSVL